MDTDTLSAKLVVIMPHADEGDITDFVSPLQSAMDAYQINTPARQAAFLAQCAEESNELWHLRSKYGTPRGEEYASGKAYEGREDLGNNEDGDGVRYKGRGLLQVTGRANYQDVSDALGYDFVSDPEALNDPIWSCKASARYWQLHGCNELADSGSVEDFTRITKKVNGGTNGLAARQSFWKTAQAEFVS